jgi:predicted RNA-binding Zn-ribbon protein involved in translation (DUF1610 family)
MPGPRKLATPEEMRAALATVRGAEHEPGAQPVCPLCGATGLTIIDRSSRPHAEWYALACPSCGLDDVISIPMSARSGSGY